MILVDVSHKDPGSRKVPDPMDPDPLHHLKTISNIDGCVGERLNWEEHGEGDDELQPDWIRWSHQDLGHRSERGRV